MKRSLSPSLSKDNESNAEKRPRKKFTPEQIAAKKIALSLLSDTTHAELCEELRTLYKLKDEELEKLYSNHAQRPYTPYSSEESFGNALQLCNFLVGVRRNCSHLIITSGPPPYGLFKPGTDPRDYLMSKNECLARETLSQLVNYKEIRKDSKRALRNRPRLRGEFVQTNGKKPWECGYCKQPIASAVTGCYKQWGRWDPCAITFPYWTRCERESDLEMLSLAKENTANTLSQNKWCQKCVEKECQRVVGTDEAELKKKADTLESLANAESFLQCELPCFDFTIFDTVTINNVPMMPKVFFPKMMELVGDIVEPYSLTQEWYQACEKVGIATRCKENERRFKAWRENRGY
jgi:hypothetical protein